MVLVYERNSLLVAQCRRHSLVALLQHLYLATQAYYQWIIAAGSHDRQVEEQSQVAERNHLEENLVVVHLCLESLADQHQDLQADHQSPGSLLHLLPDLEDQCLRLVLPAC